MARFASADSGACVHVVTRDATAPEDSAMTIKVHDVDGAYEEAQRRDYEIVHPITDEPWGIRRFFVRSPDGHVVNVALDGDTWPSQQQPGSGPSPPDSRVTTESAGTFVGRL